MQRRNLLRHRSKSGIMIDVEKKSSKFSTTAQNISAGIIAIGAILAGMYAIADQFHERNMTTAREVMTLVMDEEDLLTAAEFREYAEKHEARSKTIQAFTLDYMASIDSSLIIILPQLAATDQTIIKRLATIEAKVDANKLPNTEDKLDRVWQFLEAQAKQDSTIKRHKEIMHLLRKINEEKLKARQGDRIQ